MASAVPSRIVAFLSGSGKDTRGRWLDEILAFSDDELEHRHDYIQWLFPLDTPSQAVPGSPVLSAGDIAEIRLSGACQANLERAAERMRRFYRASDDWLVSTDHNHLRITRIIRSLVLLAGRAKGERFHADIMARVEKAGHPVARRNVAFWLGALG